MAKTQRKTLRLVQLALLAALIVVLQLYVVIPLPGGLTLSLVLVPIVVGAAVLGPAAGAILGGVFGAVVTVLVMMNRAGVLSAMMWAYSPVVTVLVCLLKGVAAGWCAGLVARLFKKRQTAGVLVAAAIAPLVNTGIFVVGLLTVFRPVLLEFAASLGMAGVSALYFAVVGIVGLNFVIEFAANLLLSPSVTLAVRKVLRRG